MKKPLSWEEFKNDLYYWYWHATTQIQRNIARRDYEVYLCTGKVVNRCEDWGFSKIN